MSRTTASVILDAINEMIAGTRKARVYEETGGVSPHYSDVYETEYQLQNEYTPIAYVDVTGDNLTKVWGAAPSPQTPRRDGKNRYYVLTDWSKITASGNISANQDIIEFLIACSNENPVSCDLQVVSITTECNIDNTGFRLLINVIGSNGQYNVSDNQGSPMELIAIGSQAAYPSAGHYPNSTSVTVTVSHPTDAECFIITGPITANCDPGPAPSSELLTFWEHLGQIPGITLAEREMMLAKSYATQELDTTPYVPAVSEIPNDFVWEEGGSWIDPQFGREHMLVVDDGGSASTGNIKNCELWRGNGNGVVPLRTTGSGSSTRNVWFYQWGLPYNVAGGGDNSLSISLDAPDSTEASERANHLFWVSPTEICYVTGNDGNTLRVHNIITDTFDDFTFPLTGGDELYMRTNDGNGARRMYNNTVMNPGRLEYESNNPNRVLPADRVHRLFPLDSDKKRYIVLSWNQSSRTWSYLTGSSVVSETDVLTIHTIDVLAGTDIDYLTLSSDGFDVVANTSGQGLRLHRIDGSFAMQIYDNSNHPAFGEFGGWNSGVGDPGNFNEHLISQKLTGNPPDNAILGGKNGDIFLIGSDPTNLTRTGYKCIDMPNYDDATRMGGDQGGATNSVCHVIANGFPSGGAGGTETWDNQLILLDWRRISVADGSKYARARIWKYSNVTGPDDQDPGAFVDSMRVINGKWVCGVYWHDHNITQGAVNNRGGIFYTLLQLPPDTDNLNTTKAALTNSGYVSHQ